MVRDEPHTWQTQPKTGKSVVICGKAPPVSFQTPQARPQQCKVVKKKKEDGRKKKRSQKQSQGDGGIRSAVVDCKYRLRRLFLILLWSSLLGLLMRGFRDDMRGSLSSLPQILIAW
jgi:hypothetical protein